MEQSWSPACPSPLGEPTSHTFPYKPGRIVCIRSTKSWLGWKSDPDFFDGSFTLSSQANFFLLKKHFGSPCWVNSVKVRQSEHARALFLATRALPLMDAR